VLEFLQRWCCELRSCIALNLGANPTIASYNASAVKIYNATSSLVRFGSKNFFVYFEKMLYTYSQLQRQLCSCKFKSRRIGSRRSTFLLCSSQDIGYVLDHFCPRRGKPIFANRQQLPGICQTGWDQGCQIFLGTRYQKPEKCTK
jgi:hypothetical protein